MIMSKLLQVFAAALVFVSATALHAQTKISDYSAFSTLDSLDIILGVDVSDTSMAASGTTKKLPISVLSSYLSAVPAGDLTGTTLAANVVTSSLTSLGTLADLGVTMANNTALTGFSLGSVTDTTSRPFSITQTWNNASFAGTGFKIVIIDTSSADTAKPLEILGGVTGSTSLLALSKVGKITLPATPSYNTPAISAASSTYGMGFSSGSVNFIASGQEAGAAVFGNWGDGVNRALLGVTALNITGFASAPSGSGAYGILTNPGVQYAIHLGISSATQQNYLFGAAGARVGTDSDTSVTNTITFHGSVSTGLGVGGAVRIATYGSNGVSGTAIGTLTTRLTIDQASVTVASGTSFSTDNVQIGHSTLTYAATTDIDFSGVGYQTLALTGDVTFTTSNLAAGRSKTIRITADATRAFTFPAWEWVGAAAPASLVTGKTAILTITSFGTTDAEVIAAYAVEP